MNMEDNQKKAYIFTTHSLRELVDYINYSRIQKEDIVKVLPDENGYSLLYYK